ncbi:MAG: alpha/beta hydrolase-fold protein [Chitinophagaceae bacterium]|jgi:enterochelin esterase-like enzyme|nr:alpha/beta hydrolase-fold protein [Chitinophagaceae bacterium]
MRDHHQPGTHQHQKTRVEHKAIASEYLEREVSIDFYLPPGMRARSEAGTRHSTILDHPAGVSLLLVNDGQDLPKMHFRHILDELIAEDSIRPLLCVGIHCGKDRKMEYGTARVLDFQGRGRKAQAYTHFIFKELLPFIRKETGAHHFHDKSFAGFSLGGLSALDIVWHHPYEFRNVGVFSGSLWWRSRDLDDGYVEDRDRIMHQLIRKGHYAPWLKFFFQTGVLDETADRNNNGIIDSIDDTLSLMDELEKKGYQRGKDMVYLEFEDGRHDVPTWGRAMPEFLRWGFSKITEH